MKNVLVEVETLDYVVWPHKCTGCGVELTSEASSTFEVNIKKGARVAFSRSTPKKLSVSLCDRCSRRISRWDKFEKFGGGLVLLAIGGPIYLSVITKGPNPPEILSGAAATFWVGGIIVIIGETMKRRIEGVKCSRRSKKEWVFSFRNPVFRNEFAEANTRGKHNE